MSKWITLIILMSCVPWVQGKSRLEMDLPQAESPSLTTSVPCTADWSVAAVKEAFEEGLKEFLSARKDLKIRFFPTMPEVVKAGAFSFVEIQFEEGSFQGIRELEVSRGRVLVTRPRFDVAKLMTSGKLEITGVEKVSFRFKVDEDDINTYLGERQGMLNMNNPHLELKDGHMVFSAKVRNRFFSSSIKTEGSFVVNADKRSVDFHSSRVSLNSFRLPGFLVGRVVSRLNPILKLDRFPLTRLIPVSLDEISIRDGYVEFIGG